MRHWSLPLLAAVALSGCQTLSWLVPGADGSARMMPRASTLSLASLQPPNQAQAEALATLDADGYDEGYHQVVKTARAHYTLEVADFEGDQEGKLKDVVFADYLTALAYAQGLGLNNVLPSVNVVDGVTKQVNDGVYARLELLIESQKKAGLRRSLYDAFKKAYDAHPDDPAWRTLVAQSAASLKLAGETPEVPASAQGTVDATLAAFQADAFRSKPFGFYTWNDDLKRIFQSDRMLQTQTSFDEGGVGLAARAASTLDADASLKTTYDAVATFYQRMTNPFSAVSPSAAIAARPAGASWEALASDPAFAAALKAGLGDGMFPNFSVLPPSRSTESTYFAKEPPGDADYMGALIAALRAGKFSFAPKPDSGFYEYQQHALEALLTAEKNPEGTKVAFGEKYLKRLEEAFKTGLTKARETHGKQLGVAVPTSVQLPPPGPRLFVEPLPTVYLRYGAMYDYLERQVLPLFDAESLKGAHVLREGASDGPTVAEEIASAKRLMYGLYLVSTANLGLVADKDLPLDAATRTQAMAEAKTWLADITKDARIGADTRVSVPIAISDEGKTLNFWGTGGVTLVKVHATFSTLPEGVSSAEGRDYFVAADKFVSFSRPYDKGILNRDEYRHILDSSANWSEAMRRLASDRP